MEDAGQAVVVVQDRSTGAVLEVRLGSRANLPAIGSSLVLGQEHAIVTSVGTERSWVLVQVESAEPPAGPVPFLSELERVIQARRNQTSEASYTRSLLDGGAVKLGRKLREEADELATAIADEAKERVANEGADLLFHMLVALTWRDLTLRDVITVLSARFGVSGHTEKASRSAQTKT